MAEAVPLVKSPSRRKLRRGRGYSLNELRMAGLTLHDARMLGLRVDKRRKSAHNYNVESLTKIKELLAKPKVEIPLTEIEGLSKAAIKALQDAGINSAEQLIEADPKELVEKTGKTMQTIRRWQKKAKSQLEAGEKVNE